MQRTKSSFVQAVSRLSDGAVDLDPVEELLVALGRAGSLALIKEVFWSSITEGNGTPDPRPIR